MDNYKLPTNIGTNDLQKLTTYTCAGVIHLLEKCMFWRDKWEQKYVVICKGLKCTWNMCCYASAFADKAEINYSMLDFESVKEYDNISENVIGFTMKFEKPTRNPLIFRCDTKESRKMWMKHAKEAIQEAHKDSGYLSDTDRQSKKYATIGDVDEDIPKKTRDTETYPDELDNGLQTNASFQMETAIATAASCEQLEPNDDEYYDCEATHSYENMIAENSSFKVYRRKPIHNEEGNTNKCERQRNVDETDVKEVYPHPVQETKIDTKAKQSSENTNKTRVKKRKSPRYRTADTGRQIPCSRYRTAESTKTANSEHIYENTAQMSLQMGKLQLDLSPEEDGSEDHSHTDVKEVYRGSIQAMVKSDISFERGSTSPSESGSQPESPVFLEPPLYTPSVIEDDNTNLKLPVAPLTTSAVTAEGIPASFVSVRSDTHTDASESFASVRAGTETVHSSERKVDAHSDLGSPPSVTDSHVCSSLTRVNTVANSNAMRTQSVSVRSANHTHVQGKQSLSMCEDASFASVREGNRCHSSSLSKPNPNAKETKTLSAAVDTVCRGDSPLTSATGAATTPTAIKTYDGHSSSQTTEESLTLLQDEEVIYENTNICYSTETKYCRQGSESSSIHSTNSSSSITSRGSDTSLRKYESPDESAHYENIKFQKDEYLCKEKKNVKRLLKKKAPGTFLVGYAEQCSDLCVMTPVGIKYFRIHQQEGKYSLFRDCSNQDYIFPNLDQLLIYYHIRELPSKEYNVKLERGYKTIEKSVETAN